MSHNSFFLKLGKINFVISSALWLSWIISSISSIQSIFNIVPIRQCKGLEIKLEAAILSTFYATEVLTTNIHPKNKMSYFMQIVFLII